MCEHRSRASKQGQRTQQPVPSGHFSYPMPLPPPLVLVPPSQPASSSSRSRSQPGPSEGSQEGDEERQRRKNVMDALVRKEQLEADPWASDVKETSVRCRGCRKVIKLDGRYQYYRGLWDKHRDTCRDIKRLKGEKIPKVCSLKFSSSGREAQTIEEFDFSSQLITDPFFLCVVL